MSWSLELHVNQLKASIDCGLPIHRDIYQRLTESGDPQKYTMIPLNKWEHNGHDGAIPSSTCCPSAQIATFAMMCGLVHRWELYVGSWSAIWCKERLYICLGNSVYWSWKNMQLAVVVWTKIRCQTETKTNHNARKWLLWECFVVAEDPTPVKIYQRAPSTPKLTPAQEAIDTPCPSMKTVD